MKAWSTRVFIFASLKSGGKGVNYSTQFSMAKMKFFPLIYLFWQWGRQLSSQNTWKRSVHGDYKFEHIILHGDGMVKKKEKRKKLN